MALMKEDIVAGLRELGVTEGMAVMAHASLSACGEVAGGADTVIAALAAAVGATGTLCMPAMAGEQPFNIKTSPSTVGIVTERFRSWPGVKRGLHPTHSACCLGPLADELLQGHIDEPTALGPQSPWGRLARRPDGYILLLGCDQDRNTLLHCAEEAVDAPYLSTIRRDYLDEQGVRRTKVLARFPGPHRDFIGLDHLFREAGAMRVGKVGKAVCRLMSAGTTLELATAALRRDPAAVLCTNPCCDDCVRQRAAITRHRLAGEDFTLAAVVDEMGLAFDYLERAARTIVDQGIQTIEFGPAFSAELLALSLEQVGAVAASLASLGVGVSLVTAPPAAASPAAVAPIAGVAQALGASLVKLPVVAGTAGDPAALAAAARELTASGLTPVVENAPGTLCDTKQGCEELLAQAPGLQLAFNPAHFAHAGEHPFLRTYYKGKLKRRVAQLYISDGCRSGSDAFTLPGQGQGEVKELMSILRCASFNGVFCLKLGRRTGKQEFIAHSQAFWDLMDRL